MNHEELANHLKRSLEGLKDFQRASVDALHEGLYGQGRPRMLLADEVGLGKTVVARGLIARLILDRITSAKGNPEPLRVTYICSNQVIAAENIRKLNPFPAAQTTRCSVSRIAYLAWPQFIPDAQKRGHLLEINTLTPATSFKLGQSIGNKLERQAIYSTLCEDRDMHEQRRGLRWLLMGKVWKTKNYHKQLEHSRTWQLRKQLPGDFIKTIKRRKVPKDAVLVREELECTGSLSLYDAVIEFASRLDGRSRERLRSPSRRLTRMLRECLIDCCLKYVKADLYVLDEFQRFRDLIDEEIESEQADIARRVFERDNKKRVLLLSATPFKAFTGLDEAERGEDHYKDFSRVLKFLLSGENEQIAHYEKHRKALHSQIMELRDGAIDNLSGSHRDEVQSVLRSVICRTERQSVSTDPNTLISDVWKQPEHQIPFGPGDIDNFRVTDQIARSLERASQLAGKPVEYCKSALFPLSFLDRYKLKEELKTLKARKHPDVCKVLTHFPEAWLDADRMDSYEWCIGDGSGPANARLSLLLQQAVGTHGAKLLWVPPSLPYYELEDAFTGSLGFSKTLLFSSWVMVPRMVSTLLSYEVERQTIANPATVEPTEEARRTYFTPENSKKKRHPVPQIRYQRRSSDRGSQLANMSNFTLLYPSQALAGCIKPLLNLREGKSLEELRAIAAERIQQRIDEAKLSQLCSVNGESDRWYWAAPLLLDRFNEDFRSVTQEWFSNPEALAKSSDDTTGDPTAENTPEPDDEPGAKGEHFEFLQQCFEDPGLVGLGPMPSDLVEILADLALGSPAVLMLRSLERMFPGEPANFNMMRAFAIADEFCSLFNKPESIAAVRLSEKHQYYWRMVADYCGSGCLQSVLDEYLHLLREQEADCNEAINQLLEAINLNASVISADSLDSFLAGKPRKFRCHYAVEFGSQRVETDSGQKRAKNLRKVFNSPFRPFVLSTTSIGQEGLDFHSYCRRIVHWNLPGNPVDLEQREGRINRYKSLVIRQQLGRKYREMLADTFPDVAVDPWRYLFELADQHERVAAGKAELIPYWHIDAEPHEEEPIKIERVIPLYPFSIDRSRLDRILKTLAIYRLAFGQPRQEELVEHLLARGFTANELEQIRKTLIVNLSPISYRES